MSRTYRSNQIRRRYRLEDEPLHLSGHTVPDGKAWAKGCGKGCGYCLNNKRHSGRKVLAATTPDEFGDYPLNESIRRGKARHENTPGSHSSTPGTGQYDVSGINFTPRAPWGSPARAALDAERYWRVNK